MRSGGTGMKGAPEFFILLPLPLGISKTFFFRALRILKEVDMIACEDTRHTQRLLGHYQISKPLYSYHSHNQTGRVPQFLQKLKEGENIALAGCRDPGGI